MEDQRITPEQLDAVLAEDYRALKQRICEVMNAAKAGRIIADTEGPVRDAHAVFRQQAYQKAIDLLAGQAGQKAFSPSAQRARRGVEE
jgi:riboflavin biosynthesis pyrimidine reductase